MKHILTGKMQDNFANERTSLLFEWNHEKVYKKLSSAALAVAIGKHPAHLLIASV